MKVIFFILFIISSKIFLFCQDHHEKYSLVFDKYILTVYCDTLNNVDIIDTSFIKKSSYFAHNDSFITCVPFDKKNVIQLEDINTREIDYKYCLDIFEYNFKIEKFKIKDISKVKLKDLRAYKNDIRAPISEVLVEIYVGTKIITNRECYVVSKGNNRLFKKRLILKELYLYGGYLEYTFYVENRAVSFQFIVN